jgi:hypothetical protein
VGFSRPVVGSIPMIAEWHADMVARHIAGRMVGGCMQAGRRTVLSTNYYGPGSRDYIWGGAGLEYVRDHSERRGEDSSYTGPPSRSLAPKPSLITSNSSPDPADDGRTPVDATTKRDVPPPPLFPPDAPACGDDAECAPRGAGFLGAVLPLRWRQAASARRPLGTPPQVRPSLATVTYTRR